MVARKAGLYNLKMISLQGYNFQTGGLAYDSSLVNIYAKISFFVPF